MLMRIRICQEKDIPRILKLGKDVFKKQKWYTRKYLTEVLHENPKTCWILEIGGVIEGARFIADDTDGRAWGWLLIMDKHYRREGLGSKFFLYTAKRLKQLGFRKIYGECHATNQVSIEWHLKIGYKLVGVFRDWYGKGNDAVVFDYDL